MKNILIAQSIILNLDLEDKLEEYSKKNNLMNTIINKNELFSSRYILKDLWKMFYNTEKVRGLIYFMEKYGKTFLLYDLNSYTYRSVVDLFVAGGITESNGEFFDKDGEKVKKKGIANIPKINLDISDQGKVLFPEKALCI